MPDEAGVRWMCCTRSGMRSAIRISTFLFGTVSLAATGPHGAPSTQITNIFAPASTPARAIYDLSLFVLAVTALIFVVVASLLVYAIVKFRGRAADADSRAGTGVRQHAD